MNRLNRRISIEGSLTFLRGTAILAGTIAVLQVPYFALRGLPLAGRLVAIGIGTALLPVALRAGKTKTIVGKLRALLLGLLLANFAVFLLGLNLSDPQHLVIHLLQWSLVFCYAAVPLLFLGSATGKVSPGKVMLLLVSLFGALLAAEALMLALIEPEGDRGIIGIRGEGIETIDFDYDPDLGAVYLPFGTLKSIYPRNPRRYFHEESFYGLLPPRRWSMYTEPKHHIGLLELPDSIARTPGIRIELPHLRPGASTQLTSAPMPIHENQPYEVRIRARADEIRSIELRVQRAIAPWDNLGLKKMLDLTTEWQTYRFDFSVADDGPFGWIVLDLFEDGVPVDISEVTFATEEDIPSPVRYVVTYTMNSQGFRDEEYSLDRPPDVFRIACLGDSVTMGEGVHFEDIFAKQLEGLLNTRARAVDGRREFQVINFGVDGFSTREERILYERKVSEYDPDVVLLTMVSNDDMPWLEYRKTLESGEMEDGGKFRLWRAAKRRFYGRRQPDFSKSMTELLRLHALTEEKGARLLVSLFRLYPKGDDQDMVDAVQPVVEEADISWVDLMGVLLESHPTRELVVYPELDGAEGVADGHPNEIAHRIMAEEMYDFLMREKLIESREAVTRTQ